MAIYPLEENIGTVKLHLSISGTFCCDADSQAHVIAVQHVSFCIVKDREPRSQATLCSVGEGRRQQYC